jgi:glycosyltransferase involved in cell wall biosynthesis
MQNGARIVCFPFTGDSSGGSHLSAMGLIRNIDRSRYEPLVVLHKPDGPLAELFKSQSIPFELGPVSSHHEPSAPHDFEALSKLVASLPPIIRFLRKRRIELVHTNDGRIHVLWGIAAKLAGAKVLWHNRNVPNSFGIRWVAPAVASHIVSVSYYAAGVNGSRVLPSHCSVIHSPFDTAVDERVNRAASRSRLLSELNCSDDTILIGYVGTLVERKRPLMFVDVLASIAKQAPHLKFAGVFLGEAWNGLDDAVRKRAAELNLSDRVHLMGFRYPGEFWLAGLDVLLVTAVDEPFGRTLIEAMLVGTAVIAADSGGNREAITNRQNGILSPPDDADAFARAIIELDGDESLKKAIVQGAHRYAKHTFGIDKHAHAICTLYDRILGVDAGRA